MKRRVALAVFAVLAACSVAGSPAFAKDGEDDGSDDGDDKEDSGDDGGGDDGGDDTSGGGDDTPGGNSGGSGGSGGSTGGNTGGSGSNASSHGDDHEDALTAVKDGRAVSLRHVLDSFKTDFGATVLDVALFQMDDGLRYRITFVDAAGRVRRVYYFAETGELIR